jgi:hypothetical protein
MRHTQRCAMPFTIHKSGGFTPLASCTHLHLSRLARSHECVSMRSVSDQSTTSLALQAILEIPQLLPTWPPPVIDTKPLPDQKRPPLHFHHRPTSKETQQHVTSESYQLVFKPAVVFFHSKPSRYLSSSGWRQHHPEPPVRVIWQV